MKDMEREYLDFLDDAVGLIFNENIFTQKARIFTFNPHTIICDASGGSRIVHESREGNDRRQQAQIVSQYQRSKAEESYKSRKVRVTFEQQVVESARK